MGLDPASSPASGRARLGARRGLGAAVLVGTMALAALSSPPPADAGQQRFVDGEMVLRLWMDLPVEAAVVWDAWTLASELVNWFPHEATMTVAEEGEYSFSWQGQPGTWTGVFLEVDRPEVLVFTWNPPEEYFSEGAYETTVRLTFEEDDEGSTRLTLEQTGFRGAAEMESHYRAWRDYFFNLRAYLLNRGAGGSPGSDASR